MAFECRSSRQTYSQYRDILLTFIFKQKRYYLKTKSYIFNENCKRSGLFMVLLTFRGIFGGLPCALEGGGVLGGILGSFRVFSGSFGSVTGTFQGFSEDLRCISCGPRGLCFKRFTASFREAL